MDVNNKKLDDLLIKIEEIKRRKIIDYKDLETFQYVDVNNNLNKLKIYNNHLIYGRRGSGKTTLMMKSLNQNSAQNDIDVIVDSQILKGDTPFNIVINLLIRILNKMNEGLQNEDIDELKKSFKKETKTLKGLIKKIINKQEKKIIEKYQKYIEIEYFLGILKTHLDLLRGKPEETHFSISHQDKSDKSITENLTKTLKTETGIKISNKVNYNLHSINGTINTLSSINYGIEVKKEQKDSKQTFTDITSIATKTITKEEVLREVKDSIIELINSYFEINPRHTVLILDDFYQVPLEKQPYIIKYFHDIYKNCISNAFCFKVCSLPNRLRMNEKGESDFSHKDDFSPIYLDNDLSSLERVKDYLINILTNIDSGLKINKQDITSLFNHDEVLLYAIIAAGGNPRDFLIIFMELIKSTRSENKLKIQKTNVYSVVKQLKEDKDSSLEDDSDINPETIRKSLEILEDEIIGVKNTNVFLYPMAKSKVHEPLLKNLVNLRYLHLIKDSISSETKKKEEFVAYLIDMSFYVSQKSLKRGLDFRHFWKTDSASRLIHLRNAPIWHFPEELLSGKTPEKVTISQ
jgi:hypothetical protein